MLVYPKALVRELNMIPVLYFRACGLFLPDTPESVRFSDFEEILLNVLKIMWLQRSPEAMYVTIRPVVA